MRSGGYALMLFNLDEASSVTVTVEVSHSAARSFTGTTLTYDKQLYDESKDNVWPGPVAASLGSVGSTASVTLAPWSMTLLRLQ